jgi:hypothetical protein
MSDDQFRAVPNDELAFLGTEPDSFIVRRIGAARASVLITRLDSGELRAFHNFQETSRRAGRSAARRPASPSG